MRRRPVCFDCDHFVATTAEGGECHFGPPEKGVKVRLIMIVRGEEVSSVHARPQETVRGYWPTVPSDSPCCRHHQDFPAYQNPGGPAVVEGPEDSPF